MGQYFSFSPRRVDTGGGAARVILREVEVTVGGLAFITSLEDGYLGGN